MEKSFTRDEATKELANLSGWALSDSMKLTKSWAFKNFSESLAFADKIGALAEAENHHPDLEVAWGKVVVTLFTHSVNGLSDKDFALAKKIDELTTVK